MYGTKSKCKTFLKGGNHSILLIKGKYLPKEINFYSLVEVKKKTQPTGFSVPFMIYATKVKLTNKI